MLPICLSANPDLPFQWQLQLTPSISMRTSRIRPTFSNIVSYPPAATGGARLAQPSAACARSIAMTLAPDIRCEAVRETFQTWNAERDSLDTELSESLVALEAYQLHLDVWHQQLARERDELQTAREQFDRDRLSAEKNHSESSAATITELHAAREKITALTTLLLSRTEELRALDNSRAEAQTELELARAREREVKAALDDHKRSLDHERSQWAVELKNLRE